MEKKRLELKLDYSSMMYIKQSHSHFKQPIFAFTTAPQDGKIETVTELTFCRESQCEYVRMELRGVRHNDIDLNKLRMVICRRVPHTIPTAVIDFKNQIALAQKMLNVIEKHYGWPLTRVYAAKAVQKMPTSWQFYYVAASKRWIKAPAMLSLFTLLFRIAEAETKFKLRGRIRSMKSLFTTLDYLAERSNSHEVRYYSKHGHRWQLVLDNYRRLFSGRNMTDLYFPQSGGYFFEEGINHLCDKSSKDRALNKAFHKIIEEGKKT